MCYVSDGVPFWQVSSPTFSWVFNLNNSKWHERKSYLQQRSRFTGSVFAFGLWLAGDTEANGRMLQITSAAAKEIDDPLIPELESLPVEDFPINMICYRADFEFTPGAGLADGHDPDETNPFAEVSWSNDGGLTYLAPVFRPIGRQGKTNNWVTVFRTGITGPQGRRWRIAVPAAVHFGITGGRMTARPTQNR
jgi:hypothetical protein